MSINSFTKNSTHYVYPNPRWDELNYLANEGESGFNFGRDGSIHQEKEREDGTIQKIVHKEFIGLQKTEVTDSNGNPQYGWRKSDYTVNEFGSLLFNEKQQGREVVTLFTGNQDGADLVKRYIESNGEHGLSPDELSELNVVSLNLLRSWKWLSWREGTLSMTNPNDVSKVVDNMVRRLDLLQQHNPSIDVANSLEVMKPFVAGVAVYQIDKTDMQKKLKDNLDTMTKNKMAVYGNLNLLRGYELNSDTRQWERNSTNPTQINSLAHTNLPQVAMDSLEQIQNLPKNINSGKDIAEMLIASSSSVEFEWLKMSLIRHVAGASNNNQTALEQAFPTLVTMARNRQLLDLSKANQNNANEGEKINGYTQNEWQKGKLSEKTLRDLSNKSNLTDSEKMLCGILISMTDSANSYRALHSHNSYLNQALQSNDDYIITPAIDPNAQLTGRVYNSIGARDWGYKECLTPCIVKRDKYGVNLEKSHLVTVDADKLDPSIMSLLVGDLSWRNRMTSKGDIYIKAGLMGGNGADHLTAKFLNNHSNQQLHGMDLQVFRSHPQTAPYRQEFENEMASLNKGVPTGIWDDLDKKTLKEVREVGKKVANGLNYGMKPKTLARNLDIDEKTASQIYQNYHNEYSSIHHTVERLEQTLLAPLKSIPDNTPAKEKYVMFFDNGIGAGGEEIYTHGTGIRFARYEDYYVMGADKNGSPIPLVKEGKPVVQDNFKNTTYFGSAKISNDYNEHRSRCEKNLNIMLQDGFIMAYNDIHFKNQRSNDFAFSYKKDQYSDGVHTQEETDSYGMTLLQNIVQASGRVSVFANGAKVNQAIKSIKALPEMKALKKDLDSNVLSMVVACTHDDARFAVHEKALPLVAPIAKEMAGHDTFTKKMHPNWQKGFGTVETVCAKTANAKGPSVQLVNDLLENPPANPFEAFQQLGYVRVRKEELATRPSAPSTQAMPTGHEPNNDNHNEPTI